MKLVTPTLLLLLQKHVLLPKKASLPDIHLERDTHIMDDTYKPKKIITQSFDNTLSHKPRLILLANDVWLIVVNLAVVYNLMLPWYT